MKNKLKPNNYFYLLMALIAIFAVPQVMANHENSHYGSRYDANIIDIDVVNNYGHQFRQYPVNSKQYNVERAYLEAKDGQAYGIKVRNKSRERIGLVIAVDGRNIISGEKSHLKSSERMYILNPYQRATYKGWRSSRNNVNEFYFTDVPDSYADRTFGDRTAMGVIAVAVFKEKNGRWYRENEQRYDDYSGSNRSKSKAGESGAAAPQSKGGYEADAEPGTGYGDDRYSPTRRVHFEAQKKPAMKHFIKYEWKASLCEMGIASCSRGYKDKNRFWPFQRNGQYAPPPPSSRYKHYGIGIFK